MIEGEEVLESAQETGYRLCMAKEHNDDDFSKVFSCCWDPNNRDRLFICSQKGSLRVYNMITSSYTDYAVQFRRFTDADTKQEAKLISYHWDKLVAIPDRPDELIFLLGVTKSLMYSALPGAVPYPEQPYISKTTRGDFTGYIYGTPVMELWTHTARVTSVAVSQSGQILASGDEQGHLKLLMLRLIDNIIPTTATKAAAKAGTGTIGGEKNRGHADPGAASASTSKNVPQFSPFLPDYKCSLHAHNGGPIFSITWLPIPIYTATDSVDYDLLSDSDAGHGAKRTRYYSLATGSADRAVRIWGISCSSTLGLKATPILVLDTLSTHVLSLNAYLSVVSSQCGGGNAASSTSSAAHLAEDKGMNKQGQLKYRTGSGTSVYIAAGTNIGAVYVWQLPTSMLFALVTNTRKPKLIDDGSCLHSLVQTSDRPIVSVALSLSTDPTPQKRMTMFGFVPSLVLAASDTAGCVRTHRQCDEELHTPSHSPHKGASSGSGSGSSGSSHPITVTGEAFFPNSVVVACSFQENPKNYKFQSPGDTWTAQDVKKRKADEIEDETTGGDENSYNSSNYNTSPGTSSNSWYSSRLLVGTSDGNVNIVKTDDAMHPTSVDMAGANATKHGKSKSLLSSGGNGGGDSDSDSSGCRAAPASSKNIAPAVSFMQEATVVSGSIRTTNSNSSSATAVPATTTSRLQLDTSLTMLEGDISINEEVELIPRRGSPYTDDAPPALSSRSTATANTSNVTFGMSINDSRDLSLEPPDDEHEHADRNYNGSDSESDQSASARPRLGNSVPTVYNKIDAGRTPRNATGQHNTYKAGMSPAAADLAGNYNTKNAGKTPRSGPSTAASSAAAASVFDFPDEPEVVRSSSSRRVGNCGSASAGVTFVSPTASAEARFTQPIPSPAPLRKPTAGSREQAAVGSDEEEEKEDDEEEDEEEAPPPPSSAPPKPESRLSAPHPNSSKSIQRQMVQLKSKIDQVMSLSTNIDDDDMAAADVDDLLSIGSFETTESDRFAGRKAAISALNVPQHMPRYEVTPVLDISNPALLYQDGRRPAQIKKSVDPAWLMRRRTQGPNTSDLQALYAPDPVVRLTISSPVTTAASIFSSTSATAGTNTSAGDMSIPKQQPVNQACVGGKHDLHCSPDQDTFYPVFSNKLIFTQVFGFGTGASGEGNAAIDRAGNIDMTSGVGAQWSDDQGFIEQSYMSELLSI